MLKKNETGKAIYDHIKRNNLDVYLYYNIDNPKELAGEYDPADRAIIVYVDKTQTIKETVKTIVHEATHDKLGHTGTKKEEVRCFLEELRFEGAELTSDKIKSIIKTVNESEVYKYLPWR